MRTYVNLHVYSMDVKRKSFDKAIVKFYETEKNVSYSQLLLYIF